MAPSTLRQQCTNAAIRNIKRIDADGFGDAPWALVKPIVSRCEDPKMLQAWEEHTPQIRGETGEIWLKFIKRDVPNWRKMPHEPKNPEMWHRVYWKLKKQADAEERQAGELLKANMSKIRKEEDGWKVAAPTKAIPEKKGRNKGVAMPFHRGSDNNGLRFTTGTKTKDFMQAARRQVAESKLQKTGVLARTTKMLNNGMAAKAISRAPQHMIEARQRQADTTRQGTARPSSATLTSGTAQSVPLATRAAQDLKMREERLRAVREGRAVSARTSPTKGKPALDAVSKASSTLPQIAFRHQRDSKSLQGTSKLSSSPHTSHHDVLSDDSLPFHATGPGKARRAGSDSKSTSESRTSAKQVQDCSRAPKQSTVLEHQTPGNMCTSDVKRISPSGSGVIPTPGAKRKAGPSILLPMKRPKR